MNTKYIYSHKQIKIYLEMWSANTDVSGCSKNVHSVIPTLIIMNNFNWMFKFYKTKKKKSQPRKREQNEEEKKRMRKVEKQTAATFIHLIGFSFD